MERGGENEHTVNLRFISYILLLSRVIVNVDALPLPFTFRAGLSERFEVDGWVVKVSGQSRDTLSKKRHP